MGYDNNNKDPLFLADMKGRKGKLNGICLHDCDFLSNDLGL